MKDFNKKFEELFGVGDEYIAFLSKDTFYFNRNDFDFDFACEYKYGISISETVEPSGVFSWIGLHIVPSVGYLNQETRGELYSFNLNQKEMEQEMFANAYHVEIKDYCVEGNTEPYLLDNKEITTIIKVISKELEDIDNCLDYYLYKREYNGSLKMDELRELTGN